MPVRRPPGERGGAARGPGEGFRIPAGCPRVRPRRRRRLSASGLRDNEWEQLGLFIDSWFSRSERGWRVPLPGRWTRGALAGSRRRGHCGRGRRRGRRFRPRGPGGPARLAGWGTSAFCSRAVLGFYALVRDTVLETFGRHLPANFSMEFEDILSSCLTSSQNSG